MKGFHLRGTWGPKPQGEEFSALTNDVNARLFFKLSETSRVTRQSLFSQMLLEISVPGDRPDELLYAASVSTFMLLPSPHLSVTGGSA